MSAVTFNLGPVALIPLGEGRLFDAGGRTIAVFRARDGRVHATEPWCPHRGGPLADGIVAAGKVVCPLHGYMFDLATGAPIHHECRALRTYAVRLNQDDEVLLTMRRTRKERARIGLLEGRMSREMAEMVRRHGGEPIAGPALHEEPVPSREPVSRFIDALAADRLPFVILQTGVGAAALVREAEAMHRLPALLDGLERATTICRGPKPAGVLAKHGVTVDVRVPSPHTTADLLDALSPLPIEGRGVGVVHYGERNEPLTAALHARGVRVDELCLYQWQLPLDLDPLRALIRGAIEGGIDALVFTSQIQLRHLLDVAAGMQLRDALHDALANRVVLAAIGPTCAEALRGAGLHPHVVPDPPKMGPLLVALTAHLNAHASGA